MIMVTLQWPHKDLSPNSRCHWSKRAKHTKISRRAAYYETAKALEETWFAFGAEVPAGEMVSVHMAFIPPDKRRRDGHNLASSMKGAIDGIADALGIDDSRFLVSHELAYETHPGGIVRVIIKGMK